MLLIAAGSAVAVGLLVVRQQRLQAVYEATRSMERAAEDDRALWQLRAQIAREIQPERVMQIASSLGPMAPIPREVCSPLPSQPPSLRTPPRRATPLTSAERTADRRR